MPIHGYTGQKKTYKASQCLHLAKKEEETALTLGKKHANRKRENRQINKTEAAYTGQKTIKYA